MRKRERTFEAKQTGRNDRPDRSGVRPPVCVSTGLPVDRANVQARSATDAAKSFPGDIIVEESRPPVVYENDVHLLRSVDFGRGPGALDEGCLLYTSDAADE